MVASSVKRGDCQSTPRILSSPNPLATSGSEAPPSRGQEASTHSEGSPKHSSGVRFSDSLQHERPSSSMPRRDLSSDADEITPIKNADEQADRTYNTTEPQESSSSRSTVKPTAPSNATQEREGKTSWWRRVATKYGSVTLENKGSVARDHLALERTFLAWLRTSLAFASIGIAVTQLFRLNTSIQTRTSSLTSKSQTSTALPLSPLLGHGLPPELIPFLQQLVQQPAHILPRAVPQNTLLDQLLLITPAGTSVHQQALDEHAAQRLRRAGKPLGATFIGISIIVLLIGFHRYFESQYWIMRGKFPASRGSISLIGLIAGALIVASLVVVLVVAPVTYQKS